jgi:hypothetical protein
MLLHVRDPRVLGPVFSVLGKMQQNIEAREVNVDVSNGIDYGLGLLAL